MNHIQTYAEALIENTERVIVGQRDALELIVVALVADGHVLLEDVPGVGKTMLARAVAVSLGVNFKRIQCTPDLLPSDITGVSVFDQQSGQFEFVPGPVFSFGPLSDVQAIWFGPAASFRERGTSRNPATERRPTDRCARRCRARPSPNELHSEGRHASLPRAGKRPAPRRAHGLRAPEALRRATPRTRLRRSTPPTSPGGPEAPSQASVPFMSSC